MVKGSHMTDESREKMSVAHANPTVETRAKMSAAGKERWSNPEERARQSVSHINPSIETRARISVALMGNTNSLGFQRPAAYKAKMSALKMGCIVSPETRAKIAAIHWRGGKQVRNARQHAKRRTLGFVPLNALFVGCEGHHVNKTDVIYLPRKLHHSVAHNQWTGKNMSKINAVAYNFLFKQEVDAAIAAKETP